MSSNSAAAASLKECCYRDKISFALYTRFREPKMYRLAARGEYEKVADRCETHPKEAAFRHKYAPHDTPLHCLLRPNVAMKKRRSLTGSVTSTAVVRKDFKFEELQEIDLERLEAVCALLEVHPAAAGTADAFSRTPLHLACMTTDPSSAMLAMTILRYYPAAASKTDIEFRTPLHFLMARSASIPLEFLSALLETNVDALVSDDIVGETPFDIFERRKSEIENYQNVKMMLARYMPCCPPRRKVRDQSGSSTTTSTSSASFGDEFQSYSHNQIITVRMVSTS